MIIAECDYYVVFNCLIKDEDGEQRLQDISDIVSQHSQFLERTSFALTKIIDVQMKPKISYEECMAFAHERKMSYREVCLDNKFNVQASLDVFASDLQCGVLETIQSKMQDTFNVLVAFMIAIVKVLHSFQYVIWDNN